MQQTAFSRTIMLALLIPLLMAALNAGYLCIQLYNPGDTSMPESLLVYCAQRVQSGQTLYQNYHQPPFNYMPYTPLYTWITGTAAHQFNLDRDGLFWMGRFFTLLCCFGVALLLYQWERGKSRFLVDASGAFFFLASTILWQWGSTNRPDLLAVLLSLGGFVLYVRSAEKQVRWLALCLFLLAFLTKQSSVAAPASLALYQALHRRYRESVLLALGFLILAVLSLAILHVSTGGLSTLNIIENNAAPMQWLNIKLIGVLFLQAASFPLILALTGGGEKSEDRPEVHYFLVALALAVVSSAKLGSNLNYYLETLAVACMLVPSGIRFLAPTPQGAVILPVVIIILSIPPFNFIVHSLQAPGFRSETEIRALVEKTDGLIVTDSPRLALISKQQFWIDPFPFSYLERQGRWDSKEPVAMLDRHAVPLVVLTLPIENSSSWQGAKRLPESVIEAIRRNYTLQRVVDNYHVYVPRN